MNRKPPHVFPCRALARFVAAAVLACGLAVAGAPDTRAQSSNAPIKKKGLIDALRLNGFTTAELIERVTRRGVDFQMTAQDERDLVAAGAKRDLVEAVRRSYRRPAPVPSTPRPRPAEPEKPTLVRRVPSYDDLIDEAEAAIERGDYSSAITRCLSAVETDETRAAAYQYLAIAEVRGRRDYVAGERYMRQAIVRGGNAVFRVDHDHIAGQGLAYARAMFNTPGTYCSGSLFVSRDGLAFRTDGQRLHEFAVDGAEVKETDKNSYFGKHAAAFNVKSSGTSRSNYNFAPASRDMRESDLAIRLIHDYVLARKGEARGGFVRRDDAPRSKKDRPTNVEETIDWLVGRQWFLSSAYLLTRENEHVQVPTDASYATFERGGKGVIGRYTNAKGTSIPLSNVTVTPGRVTYSLTDPETGLSGAVSARVVEGELRGETTHYDFFKRGLSITLGGRRYQLHEAVIRWTATPR
jgi:hypothetical protein